MKDIRESDLFKGELSNAINHISLRRTFPNTDAIVEFIADQIIASEDFQSNPYKFLKHGNKYVTQAAKQAIKESKE